MASLAQYYQALADDDANSHGVELAEGLVIFGLNTRREEIEIERRCVDGWFFLGSHTRCLDTCDDIISLSFVFESTYRRHLCHV